MNPQISRGFHSRTAAQPSQSTAERIVSAARVHFFAHGFRSVTMDDLAAELGMSKKTLYAEFSSKTALLRAVLLNKFASVEKDLDAVMARSSGNAMAGLQQLLACMQHHTEEIQPPFVRDIRREAPELFKLVEERRRKMIQRYFGRIFDEGRKAGIIRKDISGALIIEILLGAVQAIMNPAKMQQLGLEPKTGYWAIITVILDGVIKKNRSKS
jgi:TetR/AcrR family transcriptional regulator, cholesterol catabolism regulator